MDIFQKCVFGWILTMFIWTLKFIIKFLTNIRHSTQGHSGMVSSSGIILKFISIFSLYNPADFLSSSLKSDPKKELIRL